jgi:hypothetical protein
LKKLEAVAAKQLKEYATVENACATSDTYVLGKIIEEAKSKHGYNQKNHFKIANTGTLSKYVFRWGVSPMKYLKNDYLFPVVDRNKFKSNLGTTYNRRAVAKKLIIKGLTLLDAALDIDGSFVPGKSTLVVISDDLETLKILAAVLNSRIASFYVKQKYSSASYNGGVNFTTDMLDSIPIPTKLNRTLLIKKVDEIVGALDAIGIATDVVYSAIKASGGTDKLGRKLSKWFDLDRAEFVAEVEKRGVKMGLKDRTKWADLFDEQMASISQDILSLNAAEKGIDNALFSAFGISNEEQLKIPKL